MISRLFESAKFLLFAIAFICAIDNHLYKSNFGLYAMIIAVWVGAVFAMIAFIFSKSSTNIDEDK